MYGINTHSNGSMAWGLFTLNFNKRQKHISTQQKKIVTRKPICKEKNDLENKKNIKFLYLKSKQVFEVKKSQKIAQQ